MNNYFLLATGLLASGMFLYYYINSLSLFDLIDNFLDKETNIGNVSEMMVIRTNIIVYIGLLDQLILLKRNSKLFDEKRSELIFLLGKILTNDNINKKISPLFFDKLDLLKNTLSKTNTDDDLYKHRRLISELVGK